MCFSALVFFICCMFLFADERFLLFAGVYDALQKKYLKTLMFCVCETVNGAMIEEYACKIPDSIVI